MIFHSHITKGLGLSFHVIYHSLYISKRMSATVTKTYDDKKETVVTEISNLYLTSNKLLLRKSYPCQSPGRKILRKIFFDQNLISSLKMKYKLFVNLQKIGVINNKHKFKRRFSYTYLVKINLFDGIISLIFTL